MALVKSVSASSPSRYLPSQAAASIVVGTVTVILLKWFVWKLLLEVDAVTVASGGSSLSSPPRTPLVGTQLSPSRRALDTDIGMCKVGAMATLRRAAPIFGVRDLDTSMAHYRRMGFATRAY
jgi:hypothetical protein